MENGSENNHGRNDDDKFQKTLLRLIFAAGGLLLLFNGSFSKIQFEDGASLKGMFFIILSLGVGLFVFVPEECNHRLEKLCNSHYLVNAVVKFLLLGLFSMLIFFTKYPALKLHHLEGKRSRKIYDLLGVGSFSFFALLISWERQHGGEGFGVFEFMLELTMDASMDIPAGHGDGSVPNFWYMFGAYVYCFLLPIIRCCGNHLPKKEECHGNSSSSQSRIMTESGNYQPEAERFLRTNPAEGSRHGGLHQEQEAPHQGARAQEQGGPLLQQQEAPHPVEQEAQEQGGPLPQQLKAPKGGARTREQEAWARPRRRKPGTPHLDDSAESSPREGEGLNQALRRNHDDALTHFLSEESRKK